MLKALSEKGAYEEADLLFQKVQRIYPDNATFLVHRGKSSIRFIVSHSNYELKKKNYF